MKRSVAIVAGIAVLAVAGALAAQDMTTPPAGAALTPAGSATDMKAQMGQMDEHMKTMHALHDKLTSASTPEERRQVMDEQRKEMQGCMGMMGPMMQSGARMGGTGSGMMQKGKTADINAQMQMMQKRMDMMQAMMLAMMDERGMMSGPSGLDTAPRK